MHPPLPYGWLPPGWSDYRLPHARNLPEPGYTFARFLAALGMTLLARIENTVEHKLCSRIVIPSAVVARGIWRRTSPHHAGGVLKNVVSAPRARNVPEPGYTFARFLAALGMTSRGEECVTSPQTVRVLMKLCVYVMASHRRAIYIGITGPLEKRVGQHKSDFFPDSFSAHYRAHKLVYYETFDNPVRAINREKQLKGWRREKKIALINASNPKWHDLSASWGKPIAPLRNPDDNDSSAVGLFKVERRKKVTILRLTSPDGTNRLTRSLISGLTKAIHQLSDDPNPRPLIITGNGRFFSAGADLEEIAALNASDAFDFARAGQALMNAIADFPAPTCAAISGYCMGGGVDLALACRHRIAAPNAIFGHRGAALGLITGWGGTQRLPRLIGKARALQIFLTAEKLDAPQALAARVVDKISAAPLSVAMDYVTAIAG